jgi:hypothetical protein
MTQSFSLGRTLATPGALETLETLGIEPSTLFDRHLNCDWSDMCEEDQISNREALTNGSRIFSSYLLPQDTKIWVITEADRSATTILLPSEY